MLLASRTPSVNKITNSKLEIRNSKQIQMIKKQKILNNLVSDFELRNSDFILCGLGDLGAIRIEDRIKDDSRKDAKGAKLREVEKKFSLRSLRAWRENLS